MNRDISLWNNIQLCIEAYKDPITFTWLIPGISATKSQSSYRAPEFHSLTRRTVGSWKWICRASNHVPAGYIVQLMAATTLYKSFINVHRPPSLSAPSCCGLAGDDNNGDSFDRFDSNYNRFNFISYIAMKRPLLVVVVVYCSRAATELVLD